MSKADNLDNLMRKTDEELGLSYETSIYADEISNNTTYKLYKQMQKFYIMDRLEEIKQYQAARNLINQYEQMPEDRLNAEQKQLIDLKEDIDIEIDNANSKLVDTATAYMGQGEYEGIIWEPNSKYLSNELFEKHAKDLEGIFDVNMESVGRIQKENDLFFNDPDMTNNESNEESSKEKTELITKERIENGYEPASLIEEDNALDNNVDLEDIENRYAMAENNEEIDITPEGVITLEEVIRHRDELVEKQKGEDLTPEKEQAMEDINNCIRYGWLEQAEVIIKLQLGLENESCEEVEATNEEIEEKSDNQINNVIKNNIHHVAIEETRETEYDADSLV